MTKFTPTVIPKITFQKYNDMHWYIYFEGIGYAVKRYPEKRKQYASKEWTWEEKITDGEAIYREHDLEGYAKEIIAKHFPQITDEIHYQHIEQEVVALKNDKEMVSSLLDRLREAEVDGSEEDVQKILNALYQYHETHIPPVKTWWQKLIGL